MIVALGLTAVAVTAGAMASVGAPVRAQEPADSLEVILAIDASASMRPAIEEAKLAAAEFVAAMPPDVRIGLETFADQVTVLAPPTTDRALLAAQIDSIVADGDTALYDVVVGAGARFTPTVEHKVLVVLSDGKDEGSSATLDDAIAAAQGISVETISLTTAETDLASLTALGPVTSADDPAAVSSAFARVASLLVEVIEPAPSSLAPATTLRAGDHGRDCRRSTGHDGRRHCPPAAEVDLVDAGLVVGAVGIFAGLFLLGLLLFPERVSKARLGIDKPRSVSDIGMRATSAIDDALVRHGKRADLGTALALPTSR